jgi:hypothetical protein
MVARSGTLRAVSFLIDPPWQFLNGVAIARVSSNGKVRRALELGTDALFFSVSIPLYMNAKWTEPIWKPTGAESGRDWMINSQVFTFEHRKVTWRTHVISAAIFATYPLWLRLGLKLGKKRRTFPR